MPFCAAGASSCKRPIRNPTRCLQTAMPSAKSRRHPSPPDQAATPAPYLRIACEPLVNGLRTAHECMRHAPQPDANGVMQRTAAPQGQSSTADQASARRRGTALFHRSSKQRLLLTLSARFLGAYLSSFYQRRCMQKPQATFGIPQEHTLNRIPAHSSLPRPALDWRIAHLPNWHALTTRACHAKDSSRAAHR